MELEKNEDPIVVTLIQPAAIDTQFLDGGDTPKVSSITPDSNARMRAT